MPDKKTQYWLMKSEPSDYSIDDLKRDKRAPWYGVRNYQARNFMCDAMQIGDKVLFYHSSCPEPGIAGIAKVASTPYPDATQFDKKSEYFDTKAAKEKPRWFLVDVKFVKKFPSVIALSEIRKNKELKGMITLRPGNRLSITPVEKSDFEELLKISEK